MSLRGIHRQGESRSYTYQSFVLLQQRQTGPRLGTEAASFVRLVCFLVCHAYVCEIEFLLAFVASLVFCQKGSIARAARLRETHGDTFCPQLRLSALLCVRSILLLPLRKDLGISCFPMNFYFLDPKSPLADQKNAVCTI